ncbi:MAG: porin family protein [Bacteroidota bacterium]
MKSSLSVLLILLGVTTVQAQLLMGLMFAGKDKLDPDVVQMGFQVGGNVSNLTQFDEGSFNLGLLIGFYTDIKISDNLFLHTGGFPVSQFGAGAISPYSLEDESLDELLAESTVRRRLNYLGLPFMLHYKFNEKWRAGLGPQLHILLSAKDFFYREDGDNELLYSNNISDDVRALDYGLMLHTGYFLKQGKGVYLQLRYYLGFRDVIDTVPEYQANRSFQFIVGIPIRNAEDLE